MIREILTFDLLVGVLLYFFLGCIGGIAKYLYTATISGGAEHKMPISSTVVCALVTAFGMPVVERYFGERIGVELLMLIAFLMGVVGLELFGRLSTISGIFATLREARRIRHNNKKDD